MLYIKYIIACSFLLFSSNELLNEKVDSNRIAWDQKSKLKWKDFKAKPEHSSSLDAYTMLGISIEVIGQKNGKIDMGVFGYFEKNKSWVKPGERNENLLHHEQKHFDVCEVYRRILVQKLEAGNPYSFNGFSNEVGQIFEEVFADYTKEQARYDKETNHSQNKKEQAEWNKFIAQELLRLKKYDKLAASLVAE